MPASTRTVEEAAAACACAVGQIVKSLVFQGHGSGRLYLLLVSGSNMVDMDKAAAHAGEKLDRAAAGAPNAVFSVDPAKLQQVTRARVAELRRA
jgi:prolyl-tRNA editing enzyme YbaK/EbsC (Cys-tRNA(Pro) deacylase)